MAQYDVLSVEFQLPNPETQPAELSVSVDNPDAMQLAESPTHNNLPNDVEVVPTGQQPTQPFWVHENHHYLVIVLETGSGANPLEVDNTAYYNIGENPKYLDIIVATKKPDGKKQTRKVRRGVVIVAG